MVRRFKDNSGITLIEVLFASGILMTTLLLLGGSVINLAELNQTASQRQIATVHLSSVLEQVRHLPPSALWSFCPPAADGLGSGAVVAVEIHDAAGAVWPVPVVKLPKPAPPIHVVRATVRWTGVRGRPHEASGAVIVRGR